MAETLRCDHHDLLPKRVCKTVNDSFLSGNSIRPALNVIQLESKLRNLCRKRKDCPLKISKWKNFLPSGRHEW